MTDTDLIVYAARGYRTHGHEKIAWAPLVGLLGRLATRAPGAAKTVRSAWGAVKGWASKAKIPAPVPGKDTLLTRAGKAMAKKPGEAAMTGAFMIPGSPLYMPLSGGASASHARRAAQNKAIEGYYKQGLKRRTPMIRTASDKNQGITKIAYDRAEVERAYRIQQSLIKTASVGSIFQNIMQSTPKKLFMLGAGLTAGTAAAQGSMSAIHGGFGTIARALHSARESSAYNKMLKADPTLRGEPDARRYFGVVHRASPYISSEPIIAAATIRSMIESPLGAPDERRIQSVLGTENEFRKQRYPWAGPGQKPPGARDLQSASALLGDAGGGAQMGMLP